jgi:hypothetical protein
MAGKKRGKYPTLRAVLAEIRKVEKQLRSLRQGAEPAEQQEINLKLGYLVGLREQAKCPQIWNPHGGWPSRSQKKK